MAAALRPDPDSRFDPRAGTRVLWAPFRGMQTEGVNATEFEIAMGGSKGPGKTDVGIMKGTRQTNRELYKAYVTRETGPQLDEIKRRTHRIFPKLAQAPTWNGDGHGRWTWPSGAVMIFESIGTVEDVEKIHGQEPSYVFMDEGANIKDERVIDLVQAEIRSPDPLILRQFVISGNPGKPGHAWFKRRYVVPCGRDGRRIIVRKVKLPNGTVARLTRRFIPGTVLDNPIYANDPLYMAQLATLPLVLRRQLLFGDWDAGYGAALDELHEAVHLVRPFTVPPHWTQFASFDWGYAHWWVLCWFVVSEDARMYVVDTVRGRRQKPWQIAERIKRRLGSALDVLAYIDADSAPFQERRDRNDTTPSIAEELLTDHQILLRQSTNTDRVKGLNNLRSHLAWRGIGPEGEDAIPSLRFFDTPGNRWLFEQLQAMVVDESEMEDVLKVDADPETGVGGDDGYDALRVGVASRPPRAIGQFYRGPVSAFSKHTLAYMVEHLYKDRELPDPSSGRADLATFLHGV